MDEQRLAQALETCKQPEDEDVVAGILEGLLSVPRVSQRVADRDYVATLRPQDWCSVQGLRVLEQKHLEELGISQSHSAVILAVIRAPRVVSSGGGGFAAATSTQSQRKAAGPEAFPALAATGYPEAGAWAVFKPRWLSYLEVSGLVAAVEMVMLRAALVDPRAGVPGGWQVGAETDRVVCNELLNVGQGMPERLQLLLPQHMVEQGLGLQLAQEVAGKVVVVSDDSLEIQQAWITGPPRVTLGKKHMLASLLSEWRQMLSELDLGGAIQTEPGKRGSLKKLSEGLPEAVAGLSAMRALKGSAYTSADMLVVLDELAGRYSSAWAGAKRVANLTTMEEPAAPSMPRPKAQAHAAASKAPRTQECWKWSDGACKFGDACRFKHSGAAGHGKNPPYWRKGKAGGGEQAQAEAEGSSEEGEKFGRWLAQLVQGVAKRACVSRALVGRVLAKCVANSLKSGGKIPKVVARALGVNARVPGVVADTGATVRVIGAVHEFLAQNRRGLNKKVTVGTAGGEVAVEEEADLPVVGIDMSDSLVMVDSCESSLCPVVITCERENKGFQVAQGGGRARFYQDGKTVVECRKEDGLFTVPVEGDSVFHDCNEGEFDWDEVVCTVQAQPETEVTVSTPELEVGGEMEELHARVLEEGGVSSRCVACKVEIVSEGKEYAEHLLNGHRDNNKCPWCIQSVLRERQALRNKEGPGRHGSDSGYVVDSDFSGPHEPDVDGNVQGYVGVEMGSGYGYVGLQESRSASHTLESIKQLEVELKVVSGEPDRGIVAHHHDDDKSFRGVVEKHALDRGWKDTTTRGYRPNANSTCERIEAC